MKDRTKMWLYLITVIILEAIAMSILEYSANNGNNYYIIGILMYSLIAYLFYQVLIIEHLAISNALWNVSAIILVTFIGVFYFKEKIDIYGKIGILFAILSVSLMEFKNLKKLFFN